MKKKAKKGKKKKAGILLRILWVLLTVLGAFLLLGILIGLLGKSGLQKRMEQAGAEPKIAGAGGACQQEEVWEPGWVEYEGCVYEYDDEIMNFLFMGIDKDSAVLAAEEGTDGGQADALFLLVLDPGDKAIRVIGINRNTMADIALYDENGVYLSAVKAQLAVQHGFGDGMEESCRYQVEAVRRLLYQLPIHGYCAVNMDAVTELTDLIGGVELTALEDVRSAIQDETLGDYVVNQGETVRLDGRMAYSYVRYRKESMPGSADLRLERQRQFLGKFMEQVQMAAKQDITLPVKLYQTIEKQMVTDISLEEAVYLAAMALDYSFSGEQFYFLPGETVQGEVFEEFYVDEKALYELMITVFYEPVKKLNGE